MINYFNIPFEFDKNIIEDTIQSNLLSGKGYCCFVDSTMLAKQHLDKSGYLNTILNNSLINACDGSYIALIINKIHKASKLPYTGPEFFQKHIYENRRHCIIGSTLDVFNKVKYKIESTGGNSSELYYIPLPYVNVNEFNYPLIANEINKIAPSFIWIALGAPKQEIFMYKLMPLINNGILLGVGAAVGYFAGTLEEIPPWTKKYHLIWLFRLIQEPRKQARRIISILRVYPKIFISEYQRSKQKRSS